MSPPPARDLEDAQSAVGREAEVKLACPRELLASLPALDALAGANWKPRSQRLIATYFDTQDDELERAGITLRVRRSGVRRVMTLKSGLSGRKPFSRGETEVRLLEETPNVELFGPEIAAQVAATLKGKELVTRFETRVRRRIGELNLGDTLIEIALDDGEIAAGADRLPITECELELKVGEPSALFGLAARLTGSALILNPAQKSQRGYRLARQQSPAEVRAVSPMLDPASSIEDAMIEIIENTVAQFIGNWPALLEADCAESVHQMRVALRRLRAALGQFERTFPDSGFKRFREVAKTLANSLGPARDQDVFIALVTRGPFAAFSDEPSFEPLLSHFSERRQDRYRSAKETLRAPETSRFIFDLQAFVAARGWRNRLSAEQLPRLGAPARDIAGEALERLYQRTRKLGRNISQDDPERRHELRIALKKLRYWSEFFVSLYDARKVKKFSKTSSALQDALGDHNDAALALKLIEEDAAASQSRAAGIIVGWCAREITAPERFLDETWSSFRKARCFWRD
jgi:triphosphatase